MQTPTQGGGRAEQAEVVRHGQGHPEGPAGAEKVRNLEAGEPGSAECVPHPVGIEGTDLPAAVRVPGRCVALPQPGPPTSVRGRIL